MSKRSVVREQIERFTRIGLVPVPTEDLEEELLKAFISLGRSEDHIRLLADRMVLSCHYFPKPADVHDAAEFLRELASQEVCASQQPDEWRGMDAPKCPKCDGTGWISRDRVVNGVSVGVSSPCVCRVIEDDPEDAPRKSADAQRLGELGLGAAKLRQIGGGK